MCNQCSPDHEKINRYECRKCPDDWLVIFKMSISFIVLTAMIGTFSYLNMPERISRVTTLFRIMITYIHIMTIASTFKFKWPDYMHTIYDGIKAMGDAPVFLMDIECLAFQQD